MRVVFLLMFFFAASFGALDFNSKTTNFSFGLLYHTLQASNRDEVISPYAIWSLLISMAYETFGVTREEFLKVFSLTEGRSVVAEEYMKLRTSVLMNQYVPIVLMNFVFYDENFNVHPGSIGRLESDFRYIAERLSFQEPQQAAGSALSFLRSYLLRPVNTILRTEDFEDSTMILCNYFSFIAQWLNPFNVSDTTQVYYYQDGRAVGRTNMMHLRTRLLYSDLESLHASVTELPYSGDSKYCMLLVRPHKGYDVAQVLRNLREVSLKDVLDTLQRDADEFGMREVEVKLPKYADSYRVVLNTPLIDMGLSNSFDQKFANFDKFAEDKIYIGEVTHGVDIGFTEFQTKAYCSTPAFSLNTGTPAKQMPVNEPFIFFIMEKSTATVLFGGSYTKIDIN